MTLASWPALLTPSLEATLLRALQAERTATGIQRRLAFHNTRVLLGALLENGFDIHHAAHLARVTPAALRARAEKGGLLPVLSVPDLTGLSEEELAILPTHAPWASVPGPTFLAGDVTALLYRRDTRDGSSGARAGEP